MMARQQRLIFLPLLGAALLGVLIGAYLFASKRSSKPASSSRIKKHKVKKTPEETLAYWTKERMEKATPAPIPNAESRELKKRPSRRPRTSQSE